MGARCCLPCVCPRLALPSGPGGDAAVFLVWRRRALRIGAKLDLRVSSTFAFLTLCYVLSCFAFFCCRNVEQCYCDVYFCSVVILLCLRISVLFNFCYVLSCFAFDIYIFLLWIFLFCFTFFSHKEFHHKAPQRKKNEGVGLASVL